MFFSKAPLCSTLSGAISTSAGRERPTEDAVSTCGRDCSAGEVLVAKAMFFSCAIRVALLCTEAFSCDTLEVTSTAAFSF